MKLTQLTDTQLLEKKNHTLSQLKNAIGYRKRDLYKCLERIEKERIRRALIKEKTNG